MACRRLRAIAAHLNAPTDQGEGVVAAVPTAVGTAPMTIAKVETIYTKPAWVFVKITTARAPLPLPASAHVSTRLAPPHRQLATPPAPP